MKLHWRAMQHLHIDRVVDLQTLLSIASCTERCLAFCFVRLNVDKIC